MKKRGVPRKELIAIRLMPFKISALDTIAEKMGGRRTDVLRMIIDEGINRYQTFFFNSFNSNENQADCILELEERNKTSLPKSNEYQPPTPLVAQAEQSETSTAAEEINWDEELEPMAF